MASYNRVTLMGNITRDVELRYLPGNQTPCVELGIAMNEKYKDKSGQQREDVCFVDAVFFGKTAETIAQYFSKGDPILIDGKLQFDQWEDQNGNRRSKHKIKGERFTFVGGGGQQQPAAPVQHGPGYPAPQHQAPPTGGDDIPF